MGKLFSKPGIPLETKEFHGQSRGEVSLYGLPPVYFVWIQLLCFECITDLLCLVSQTGTQLYSDTSHVSLLMDGY